MSIRAFRVRARTYLLVAARRYRERGAAWLLPALARHAASELLWLAMLPLALAGHMLGYRRINVFVEHIGHLAVEPDCLLKEVRLGRIAPRRWLLLAPPGRVSNGHLLQYWKPHLTVVTSPWLCTLLAIMSRRLLMTHDVSGYVARYFGRQQVYPVNAEWGARPPVLALTVEDESWGLRTLEELGVPAGKWFVAVHVREGGYLPRNELIQSHRNASIANAIPAMQEIVRRGGVCIRVGDRTMAPLPAMDGVSDYARHHLKSERMDVYLCARARFFLGCTSGLAFLASAFGVPVAHANMIPVETLGIRQGDLSMPKLLWSSRLGRHLTFAEILGSEVGGYFFSQQYAEAGIEVQENSADDIRGLVTEMLDRLDGSHEATAPARQLHDRYMALFKPEHYSFGACSRVSEAFLVRHSHLL